MQKRASFSIARNTTGSKKTSLNKKQSKSLVTPFKKQGGSRDVRLNHTLDTSYVSKKSFGSIGINANNHNESIHSLSRVRGPSGTMSVVGAATNIMETRRK